MESFAIGAQTTMGDVMNVAQCSVGPVVLTKADEECLVVMRPDVFETLLFGSFSLECEGRSSFRL